MIEIAQEAQKVKNLEVPEKYHSKIQDLVADFKNNQEMAIAVQGAYAGADRPILSTPSKSAGENRTAGAGMMAHGFGDDPLPLSKHGVHSAATSPTSTLEAFNSPVSAAPVLYA